MVGKKKKKKRNDERKHPKTPERRKEGRKQGRRKEEGKEDERHKGNHTNIPTTQSYNLCHTMYKNTPTPHEAERGKNAHLKSSHHTKFPQYTLFSLFSQVKARKKNNVI